MLDQKPAASDAVSYYSCNNRESQRSTLVDFCRYVLVNNLERYPPDAFGILDEEEWENVIRVRYERTRPQKGKGGLDGRGRMNPAVGDKFMLELERTTPHLAQSGVVDNLVWKDIVEFRFKVGGLSRPTCLLYPWPVLEGLAVEYAHNLSHISKIGGLDKEARKLGFRTIKEVCEMPMDVLLLKSSGIGKAVKKFIKACSSNHSLQIFDEPISSSNIRETPRTKLEVVLQSWMTMAAENGVKMKASGEQEASVDPSCSKHLAKAKTCNSWRELYTILHEYDEKRRSTQGARMRERRQRLGTSTHSSSYRNRRLFSQNLFIDSVRPKIVKVRHASSRQNDILDRQRSSVASSPAKQKIQQLRMEASVTSLRRGLTLTSPAKPPPPRAASGFGAAVAFASAHRGAKRKHAPTSRTTTTVQLAGNKRMQVPDSKRAAENMKRLAKKGGFSFG
jgi:hypothetical protein